MLTFDNYVTDALMRDLVGHDKRPASFLVYLWLAAEQQRRASDVQISYQELAESIGISKSSDGSGLAGAEEAVDREKGERYGDSMLQGYEPVETIAMDAPGRTV